MFCEKCGTAIQNGDKFCMSCGTKFECQNIAEGTITICQNCNTQFASILRECPNCGVVSDTTENNNIIEPSSEIPLDDGVLRCPDCGFEIMENEIYCIRCGTPIINSTDKSQREQEEVGLQTELLKIFNSNKVMSFFLKYALVFVLAYPIYTLMGRFDFLNSIYGFISNFTIIFYFAYNIGLLAAYTNKKFLGLFIALALRLLNSSILVFQSSSPWQSLFRISIIIISAIFVYKKLMTDSQRQDLIGKFKTTNVTCAKCGCSVKKNDAYCPKCGNRM